MNNDSIKENIIRRRTEEGISQDEMARRLDISRNTYRSIEKGPTSIISRRLGEIASLLNVTEEELMLGYKPINRTSELEDMRNGYDDRLNSMKRAYEARLQEKDNEIATLKEANSNLKELLDAKDEIISLLKRERRGSL